MSRMMDSTKEDKDDLKKVPYKPRLYKMKVKLFCIKWNTELLSNRGACVAPRPYVFYTCL